MGKRKRRRFAGGKHETRIEQEIRLAALSVSLATAKGGGAGERGYLRGLLVGVEQCGAASPNRRRRVIEDALAIAATPWDDL